MKRGKRNDMKRSTYEPLVAILHEPTKGVSYSTDTPLVQRSTNQRFAFFSKALVSVQDGHRPSFEAFEGEEKDDEEEFFVAPAEDGPAAEADRPLGRAAGRPIQIRRY